jgi:hypothetical protein
VDGKNLLEEPEEQKTLALILDLRNNGKTRQAIADELNRRGIVAKKGGIIEKKRTT